MPANYPSYTQCSSPSGWSALPVAVVSVLAGVGLLAGLLAGLAGAWAPGVAAFMAMLCLAAIYFCTWWLNTRLICLGGDKSTIGVIYHLEPPDPTDDAFGFGSYDTDYSFHLLLWPFTPVDRLPLSFTNDEWNPAALTQLETVDWPTLFPSIPFAEVKDEVTLIVPQQTMAANNLGFAGVGPDNPPAPPAGFSNQFFMQHCEIEGPGMHDLRILLWVLFGVYVAAAAVSVIPVIGSVIAWILALLAFLAFLIGGAAITHSTASPPADFGGSFNAYEGGSDPSTVVDMAYCYGRWVYDSLHSGWNELHPLHYMIKIGETTKGDIDAGNWPDLGTTKTRLDTAFADTNKPESRSTQQQAENQWTLHPLVDGCQGGTGYPVIG